MGRGPVIVWERDGDCGVMAGSRGSEGVEIRDL